MCSTQSRHSIPFAHVQFDKLSLSQGSNRIHLLFAFELDDGPLKLIISVRPCQILQTIDKPELAFIIFSPKKALAEAIQKYSRLKAAPETSHYLLVELSLASHITAGQYR